MKNIRIGRKLGLGFGGAALCLLLLTGFAVSQLATLDNLTDTIVNNRQVKLILAQDMRAAAGQFRIAEGSHILMNDDAGMNVEEATMRTQVAKVDQDYARLDAIVTVPAARTALRAFHQSWQDYIAVHGRILQLSRAQQNEQATALMIGQSRRAYRASFAAANDLALIQAKLAGDSSKEAADVYGTARMLCIAAALIALCGLMTLLLILVRQIATPISTVTGALTALARGDMQVAVPASDRADEVGELIKAMVALRDQLAAAEAAKQAQTVLIVESVGQGLARLADGDLVSRIDAELTGPFAKLKDDFNHAVTTLQQTIGQVSRSTGGINTGAIEIRQASDDLSHRTEQQAASLEETAAAMDEITATVRQTAQDADAANGVVRGTRAQAEQGGAVVQRAVAAMDGIERASAEISEIIGVIDGIAFQTNLLALNAGVEAARAGDAGKGFAVVASEVRALAQRSADAAKDVKTKILASSQQVKTGVELVSETGQALQRIIGEIGAISTLVEGIASAADQQATGLQQVNTAVNEMDGVTQQNAAMVEEATAAARSLASEADELARQIARFRTGSGAGASDVSTVAARSIGRAEVEREAPRPRRVAAGGGRGSAVATIANDDWSQF